MCCMVHLSREVWLDHTMVSERVAEVVGRAIQEAECSNWVVELATELNVVAGRTTSVAG